MTTKTVQTALSDAILALFDSSSSPEIDAEVLLGHCLKQSRAWLLTYQDEELTPEDIDRFDAYIQRRHQGEPIAYIVGTREFWSLNLTVNESTLIPRPETEILVEIALEKAALFTTEAFHDDPQQTQHSIHIVDLGTGSGAIALALATELPKAQITAVDMSAEALSIAQKNADTHHLNHVNFLQSNWFSALQDQQFDVICSNPPYIESQDPHLQQGDLRFEPNTALASGADGFFDITHIISHAKDYLNEGGWLILEHGFQQAQRTQALLQEHGFANIDTRSDYAGHPRITFAQKQTIKDL